MEQQHFALSSARPQRFLNLQDRLSSVELQYYKSDMNRKIKM